MMKIRLILILNIYWIILAGCAAHPTISPTPLKEGERVKYMTLSSETVAPVITWRTGLSDHSDFGLHLGIPIYGSGIDYSYRLQQNARGSGDILNAGIFLTPNANLDLSYYKIGTLGKANRVHPSFGWRVMYIPSGLTNYGSIRFGFLAGLTIDERFGVEMGYFHDFIDEGEWWYLDTALATEKNPLTGLSIRVSFFTGQVLPGNE